MNRHKSMRITRHDPRKKCRLGTVSKNVLLEGLNRVHAANPNLSSDVDQDTFHLVFFVRYKIKYLVSLNIFLCLFNEMVPNILRLEMMKLITTLLNI